MSHLGEGAERELACADLHGTIGQLRLIGPSKKKKKVSSTFSLSFFLQP